jgi:very-short-patch-repair endonuclease
MDLSKTQKNGPRVFKRFLEYAKTGQMDEKAPTGLLADSPFEGDVAEVVRKLGYEVDYQVGSGGFRIDLGVRHPDRPGQYMLAIECDGATYHSALWARERDRLRQAVLEGLGWKFYRIWSTDWFHRRSAEIDRLKATLGDAQYMYADGIRVSGANEGYELADSAASTELAEQAINIPSIEAISIKAPPYERSKVSVDSAMKPNEVPHAQLATIVLRIIRDEGPIHKDEVARRLANAFGKQRVGVRIQNTNESVLTLIAQTHSEEIVQDGNFWFTYDQQRSPPIRDRSEESGNTLKAEMISPIEIRAAAEMIIAESGQVGSEDLTQAVSYLLGYKRLGPDLRSYIGHVLS